MQVSQSNVNVNVATNEPKVIANAKSEASDGKVLPSSPNGSDRVSISARAQALYEQDKRQLEQGGNKSDNETSKSVKSFAHGALGMDHPDAIKEQEDASYSAGQYVSAAATIGALILALA